jgi:mRNA interferase ChpB
MVKANCFERGDIVLVGFDPALGHEPRGNGRHGLVLTPRRFNLLGTILVAPIAQGGNLARFAGFTVPLISQEAKVHGVVLLNQVRMMDLQERGAIKVDTATEEVVEDALLRFQALVE